MKKFMAVTAGQTTELKGNEGVLKCQQVLWEDRAKTIWDFIDMLRDKLPQYYTGDIYVYTLEGKSGLVVDIKAKPEPETPKDENPNCCEGADEGN